MTQYTESGSNSGRYTGRNFIAKDNIKIHHYLKEEYEYECGLYPGKN